MRKLLIPAFLVLMSNSYAQDCIQRICVGEQVITSDDNLITVERIENSQIVYSSYNREYTITPSKLTKKSTHQNYPVGKNILNDNDSIGVVSEYFEDGRIRYKINSYYYVDTNLAYEVDSIKNLVKNDEVINSNDSIGNIQMLFSNNKVQLKLGSYNYIVSASDLSERISRIGVLSEKTSIINDNDSIGVVERLYENNRIEVRIGSYKYIVRANTLSIEVNSLGNLKQGSSIINDNDSIGSVVRLFANDRVQVQIGSYKYIVNSNSLSLENLGLGDIKPGAIALHDGEVVSKVLKTFDNSKVQIKRGSYTYIVRATDLSAEIDSHEKYNKEDTYALGVMVGKVLHFFKDGQLAIQSANGQLTVGTELSEEVPSIGKISAGNLIVSSAGGDLEVLKLFANKTVLVKDQNNKNVSVKFVESAADLTADDLIKYAQEMLNNQSDYKYTTLASTMEESNLIKKKVASNIGDIKKYLYADKSELKKFYKSLGVEGSETEEGGLGKDLVQVNLNMPIFKEIVASALKKQGVNFVFTDKLTGERQLELNIERDRGFPLTQCYVSGKFKLNQGGTEIKMSSTRNKPVLGWGKKACKSVIKKVIKTIF